MRFCAGRFRGSWDGVLFVQNQSYNMSVHIISDPYQMIITLGT